MFKIALFCILFYPFFSIAQLNIDSVSHINYQQLHDTYLNDVWGFVDELDNEYILVGTRKGTSIVDISNPANPQEVFWQPGTESIWRDLSSWNNFAYVTTEAESGLMIMDLTSLPDPSGINVSFYSGEIGSEWTAAHTLFIDSNGYAYIFGSNRGNGGVIILDVHTDPLNPIEVGTFDNWYCHDGYVLNDTMYLAHIADGFISMVDVTDKSNPILLGTKNTNNNFSHNIWTTPNGNIGFTTDEVSGAFIGSYDLSDPQNIVQVDKIQSSPGKGVIPHNTHFRDNFIITSYYSDGITIHDVTRPSNLVQTGFYDTYAGQTINFDGCWGVFPFFPSGIIAATDITEGLYILNPTYTHASYLEGLVRNASDLSPLSNVSVVIEGDDQTEISKSSGNYETGIMGAGNYNVTFSKVAFYPQTINVNLQEGLVTELNVDLIPIPPFPLTVTVLETGNEQPIFDAQIRLEATLISHEQLANGLGESSFNLFYNEIYKVTCGKWGFVTFCDEIEINETTGNIIIHLEKGIYDDFSFDFGWIATKTSLVSSGEWERGNPNPTSTLSAPADDAQFDCGDFAYVTGNDPSLNPDADDVDKGRVTLYSPIFDLSTYANPYLNYARWFFNFHGPLPPADDTLEIKLSNGTTTVLIDSQASEDTAFYHWMPKSIHVSDFIIPTANMQLIVTVSDDDPAVNITEAGIDFFNVSETSILETKENVYAKNIIFPIPTNGIVSIIQTEISNNWFVYSIDGKILQNIKFQSDKIDVDLTSLQSGTYIIQSDQEIYRVIKE
jgi:choice-of-anchor B domain-containing protein